MERGGGGQEQMRSSISCCQSRYRFVQISNHSHANHIEAPELRVQPKRWWQEVGAECERARTEYHPGKDAIPRVSRVPVLQNISLGHFDDTANVEGTSKRHHCNTPRRQESLSRRSVSLRPPIQSVSRLARLTETATTSARGTPVLFHFVSGSEATPERKRESNPEMSKA